MNAAFPIVDVLCCGERVVLRWPDGDDADRITTLRNQSQVRRRFLDQRLLDPIVNRAWLLSGMDRSHEAILAIRWASNGLFLGMIGWTDWDQERRTACFGRLAVASHVLRQLPQSELLNYSGVAVDAALALRDFAFERMELAEATTWYLADNMQSAHINRAVGMVEQERRLRVREDGTAVQTVELVLTRARWESLSKERT